jgi:hypothetical protein
LINKIKNSLYILLFVLLVGCGFDITHALVKIKPSEVEPPKPSVNWIYYNDYDYDSISLMTNKCFLLYFKEELACWESDALDDSFKDYNVVTTVNRHFVNFKGSSDLESYESGLFRFVMDHPPCVAILQPMESNILAYHCGAMNKKELYNLINNTLETCR